MKWRDQDLYLDQVVQLHVVSERHRAMISRAAWPFPLSIVGRFLDYCERCSRSVQKVWFDLKGTGSNPERRGYSIVRQGVRQRSMDITSNASCQARAKLRARVNKPNALTITTRESDGRWGRYQKKEKSKPNQRSRPYVLEIRGSLA